MKLTQETAEFLNEALWAMVTSETMESIFPSPVGHDCASITRLMNDKRWNIFHYKLEGRVIYESETLKHFYLGNSYSETIKPTAFYWHDDRITLTTHTDSFLRNGGFVSIYNDERKESEVSQSLIDTNIAVQKNFTSQKIVSRDTLIVAGVSVFIALLTLGWNVYKDLLLSSQPQSVPLQLLQRKEQESDSLKKILEKNQISIDSVVYYKKALDKILNERNKNPTN